MAAERGAAARAQPNVFTATLARFKPAGRSANKRHASKKFPLFARFAARERAKAPDPASVAVAVFAIDQVGPAAVRACASGVEVRIAAGDEATAAVIRAALAETSRHRPTDRLIRVVIE
jgi:hypothetical protein